jgi:hypothetical protein
MPCRRHPRGTRGFVGVPFGGDEAGEVGGGGLQRRWLGFPRVARGGRRGGGELSRKMLNLSLISDSLGLPLPPT